MRIDPLSLHVDHLDTFDPDVTVITQENPKLTLREVATLIARGYSNRDIANQLVITEGTAANHVEHILTKLVFNSRAQIAAWAAENKLA